MPMHSSVNLYPGINLHLNSYLQNEPGGWESFHTDHITYLREVLDSILPSGYFTRSEKSLQISEFNLAQGIARRSSTKPDVTIHRAGTVAVSTGTLEASQPVMVVPLIETFEIEDELSGVVIYEVTGNQPMKPVTRLELLSPANKPGGSHHRLYMDKRRETLSSGLNLVEIDYLHETPPVTAILKDYSSGTAGALPYTILVNIPHPTLEKGETFVFGWHVTNALPVVPVPLAGEDAIALDFGRVYQLTFERTRFYEMIVDYEQNPVHFEKYAPADREQAEALLENIRSGFKNNQS